MNIILYILDAIFLVAMLVCGYLLGRNSKVLKLRRELIKSIFEFQDYEWRIKVFESVSYDDMLLSIKPLQVDSFYKDLSFLKHADITKPVLSPFQIARF